MSARYSSYGVIAAALLLAASARAQEAHYTYDADGRLIAQSPRVDGVAIVGLAPAYGAKGTLVSIEGYGFDPVAANNQVSFGGVMAAVDSATPELIVATVPAGAATGPVTVVAGAKSATSAMDFIVLPAGADLSGIVGRSPLPLDGTDHSYGSLANRGYALSYTSVAGDFVSVDLDWGTCSGPASTGITYKAYGPSGNTVANGSLIETSPTLLLPKAAASGTHTLVLSAPEAWTCHLRAQLDGKVHPDESPIHLVTTLPYHTKRILFDVPDGGAFGVASTGLTTMPQGGALVMGFNGPSGESAGAYACGYQGYGECQGQIIYRPAGTYAAVLQPYDTRTKTIDSQFWLTTYVDGGAIEPGTTVHANVEKPGQVIRYTFHGHVGDQLRLLESDAVLGPGGWYDYLTGRNPAGECIFDNNYYCSISGPTSPYDFAPLRMDGVYTLYYVLKSLGAQAPTGTATFTLSSPVQAQAPASGGHTDVSTSVTAQKVVMPFDINDDEDFSLSLTDVVSLPSPFYIKATVVRPDGSTLTSFDCGTGWGGCYTTLQHAPHGRYALVLECEDQRTHTFSARVWRVPFIDGGVFDINSKKTITAALPGQVTRFTVPASAGQLLHFFTNNVTMGAGAQSPYVSGKNPEGACFFDNNYYCSTGLGQNAVYDPPALRLSGDYNLLVSLGSNGNQAPLGQLDLSLSATADFNLAEGDTEHVAATSISGQHVSGTFEAKAGEQFTLSLTDVTATMDRPVEGHIFNPGGGLLGYVYCGGTGGCAYTVKNATAGVYQFDLKSYYGDGSVFSTRVLKSVVADGGALLPDVPKVVTVDRPGNAVKLHVAGKAGDSFVLSITHPTPGSHGGDAAITGYGADNQCAFANNYYCSATSNASNATIGPFAADGERDIYFYIVSDGVSAATGSATVTITPVK